MPVGHCVLATGLRAARAWRAARPGDEPAVAVNVGPQQLVRDDRPRRRRRACSRETGLAARLACTSRSPSRPDGRARPGRDGAGPAPDLGVRIALDDFGTGYSSLAYLRRLPVDLLKVDRSFAVDLGEDASATAVVAAVIELAHALALPVVAEGVEREEQVALLADLGCDYVQGYALARPMPGERMGALLATGHADGARPDPGWVRAA